MPQSYSLNHIISLSNVTGDQLTSSGPTNIKLVKAVTADDDPALKAFWQKYVCRGQKLHQASISNKEQAVQYATPIDSQFDGTLENELARWGYLEYNEDAAPNCWFSLYIPTELKALNIDPRGSDQGGPNKCFLFQHWNRDAHDKGGPVPVEEQDYFVDGKAFKVSRQSLSGYKPTSNRSPGNKRLRCHWRKRTRRRDLLFECQVGSRGSKGSLASG